MKPITLSKLSKKIDRKTFMNSSLAGQRNEDPRKDGKRSTKMVWYNSQAPAKCILVEKIKHSLFLNETYLYVVTKDLEQPKSGDLIQMKKLKNVKKISKVPQMKMIDGIKRQNFSLNSLNGSNLMRKRIISDKS